MMKRIDPYWISIMGIIAGALMIFYSCAQSHNRVEITAYIGAALVCTGMVTLTIGEIFKKP